jgi:hypothetical protein
LTATNHALTGAGIALIIGNPLIAIPLAFLSHFFCDALPHFDHSPSTPKEKWMRSKKFKRLLITDASLCVLLVLFLAIHHPTNWLLASVCAFLATSPDLAWYQGYRAVKSGKQWKPKPIYKFAVVIQWFAKPIGAVVEIAWFIAGITVLSLYVH